MTSIKYIIIFLITINYSFSSGLSDVKSNVVKQTVTNKATDAVNKWQPDRFLPWHKEKKPNKAAMKLGINFKFVEFSLEDSSHSQTGVNSSNISPSVIDVGETIEFEKKLEPSYEIMFTIKPGSNYDSPLFSINFWFYQQKPIESSFQPSLDQNLSSIYSLSPNSFLSNVNSVLFNHDIKLRMLKAFVWKYIISSKYFFLATGFGTNILVINHTRNITYSSDQATHCLCFTQAIKGADMHLLTNLGFNISDSVGLEMYYETGLLFNKYKIYSHSFEET